MNQIFKSKCKNLKFEIWDYSQLVTANKSKKTKKVVST